VARDGENRALLSSGVHEEILLMRFHRAAGT
jgi:hypothetical protein